MSDCFTVAQVATMLQLPPDIVWGILYHVPGLRVGPYGEEPMLSRKVFYQWISDAYLSVTANMEDSCDPW